MNPTSSLYLQPTTSEEILECIDNLKDCAAGEEWIKASLLKAICPDISGLLVHVVNLFFKEGQFPQILKDAIIMPVHKGKARSNVSNYRPVSFLRILSKILEWCMYNRLYIYLNQNNFIYADQYGFCAGHSMDFALIGY